MVNARLVSTPLDLIKSLLLVSTALDLTKSVLDLTKSLRLVSTALDLTRSALDLTKSVLDLTKSLRLRSLSLRAQSRSLPLPLLLLLPLGTFAQDEVARNTALRKGQWFIYWGYNRSWYAESDIRFEGDNHDFALRDVRAHDRPVGFDAKTYLAPSTIWVPQYNYRVGYFIHDRWSLSLGMDHMKYVVDPYQKVRMDGYARQTGTGETGGYNGTQEVTLSPDFLQYEHTDGLNLIALDADHYDRLWRSRSEQYGVDAFLGAHAGAVVPRTDVRLFGEGINNRFHLAGWGAGAQGGLHVTLFRTLFVRSTVRGGYMDLLDVLTTGSDADRASQHFWYVEWSTVVGAQFRLGK